MATDTVKFALFMMYLNRVVSYSFNEQETTNIKQQIESLFAVPLSEQTVREHVLDLVKGLSQGNLIQAIRAIRSLTGSGLKEAKDLAELIRNSEHVGANRDSEREVDQNRVKNLVFAISQKRFAEASNLYSALTGESYTVADEAIHNAIISSHSDDPYGDDPF